MTAADVITPWKPRPDENAHWLNNGTLYGTASAWFHGEYALHRFPEPGWEPDIAPIEPRG
ncbi:hypothetical protein ABZ953_06925 [Streptomyces sp. NPDC046465]|uniref:hypothetical protein n=1 Tax=Streptomyces sp. NPDC046465 TaxID=3155810 RepID=UPI0033F7840E